MTIAVQITNYLTTARIASQQRPTTSPTLKPASTNTLMFDEKNEKIALFENLFHTTLKMQPETTEAMKINHFHDHSRKEALHIFPKQKCNRQKNS